MYEGLWLSIVIVMEYMEQCMQGYDERPWKYLNVISLDVYDCICKLFINLLEFELKFAMQKI